MEGRILDDLLRMLDASPDVQFQLPTDRQRSDLFDLIAWIHPRDDRIAILENPVAFEVKATPRLSSPQITELLNRASERQIRSLVLLTEARVSDSSKITHLKRAQKKGLTLIIIDEFSIWRQQIRGDLISNLSQAAMVP